MTDRKAALAKRQREQKQRERAKEREQKKTERRARKDAGPGAEGEDPDLAGIVPGPQPPPTDSLTDPPTETEG